MAETASLVVRQFRGAIQSIQFFIIPNNQIDEVSRPALQQINNTQVCINVLARNTYDKRNKLPSINYIDLLLDQTIHEDEFFEHFESATSIMDELKRIHPQPNGWNQYSRSPESFVKDPLPIITAIYTYSITCPD